MITISDIESTFYSEHYGKGRRDAARSGKLLAETSSTFGNVRAINDTFILKDKTLDTNKVVFGAVFPNDCTLIRGVFDTYHTDNAASGTCHLNLYSRPDPDGYFIRTLFYQHHTNVLNTQYHFWQDVTEIYVPAGAVLGIVPEASAVIDCSIAYNLLILGP